MERGAAQPPSPQRVEQNNGPLVPNRSEAWQDEYDADVKAGVPATHGLPTAAELPTCPYFDNFLIQKAHYLATKDALLEHARMGRPVCEGRDGKVAWITPAEIFARYGLDEFGRPKPE